MIGKIVVELMDTLLSILATIILIIGGIAGYSLPNQLTGLDLPPWMTAVGGILIAFIFIVVTFGVLFLLLEMHKTLAEIRDSVKNNNTSRRDFGKLEPL